MRGNVQSPENRIPLMWAAWVLREEDEVAMSSDDMEGLNAELAGLEAALRESSLSPYLADFIQRQIATIRAALRVYGVQGARPLREALKKVVGDLTMERPRVDAEVAKATPEAKSVLAKASSAIEKTAKVCDSLDKMAKFGEHAWTMVSTVGPLVLPYIATKLGGC